MTVVVVDAHLEPAQPLQGVRVSLSFLDGAMPITDTREVTNRSGEALLSITEEARQRNELRLEVAGATNLVVYQPADGFLYGAPSTVTLQLLPKGSPALKGPAQIEQMLYRYARRIERLEAVVAEARRQKPDFATALKEWADANGFTYEEVEEAVRQWSADVQRHRQQATLRQTALAALANRNYDEVIQLTEEGRKASLHELDEIQLAYLEKRRKILQETLSWADMQAHGYQLKLQYHMATGALEAARDLTAEEVHRYPEDKALRGLWLLAVGKAAVARGKEGTVAAAGDDLPLLAHSIDDYRSLLREYTAQQERGDRAKAQNNLATALVWEADRASGEKAAALLDEAVRTYRQSLEVRTEADRPNEWAETETNLANALGYEAEQGAPDKAAALLGEAVEAYRKALTVRTRSGFAEDWAATESDLGTTLVDQAERTSGEQALALLSQAVDALLAALEVCNRSEAPENWARQEVNLGHALHDEAKRASRAKAASLFEQAADAYRKALEVLTRTDVPQEWAAAQNNLGTVLFSQAKRETGDEAGAHFEQAVQAYRSTLEVYTRAGLPRGWAATENNLGNALGYEAELAPRDKAPALFEQALQAFRSALEVYTRSDLPQYWALAENNLAGALMKESELLTGGKASAGLDEAAQAYRNVLEVYTRTEDPQDWAMAETNLAAVLWDEAKKTDASRAGALFDEAAQASRSALEVYTKAADPEDWALAQFNLGGLLVDEARRAGGQRSSALFGQAVQAYRHSLEVYTRADRPNDWAETEIQFGSALAFQGDIPAAKQALEAGLEVDPSDPQYLPVAVSAYRDGLFQYDRAYELTARWIKPDSSPDLRLNLVEADLTTNRFLDCARQAESIDDAAFPAPAMPMILIRDTARLACQWGAGQKAAALETAKALLPKAGGLERTGWEFGGVRHFLAASPAFEAGRGSWVAVFQSLEDGEAAAMASALRQLTEVMKH
jgi:tetratricopeptide (TPR) repeat protein